jgi:hypothetical protein
MPLLLIDGVADRIRGLDASIGFDVEKARPENIGKNFVDDTINIVSQPFQDGLRYLLTKLVCKCDAPAARKMD